MTNYADRATELVTKSSVAVQVLMGAPDDMEMVPLLPRAADEKWLAELRERWPGRGLRAVGVIGLCGTTPRVVLKNPLEPEQTDALAAAFLTYLRVLFFESYASSEIAELERLCALPDNRFPN
jgi:hypothetical protein